MEKTIKIIIEDYKNPEELLLKLQNITKDKAIHIVFNIDTGTDDYAVAYCEEPISIQEAQEAYEKWYSEQEESDYLQETQ